MEVIMRIYNSPRFFTLPQWGLEAGRNWDLLEGFDAGQTQVDQPPASNLPILQPSSKSFKFELFVLGHADLERVRQDGEVAVWAHPLDAHYACKVRMLPSLNSPFAFVLEPDWANRGRAEEPHRVATPLGSSLEPGHPRQQRDWCASICMTCPCSSCSGSPPSASLLT